MPTIYEKKIFQTGNGGLAIYIPIAWARFFNLKPKDTVIMIADGELIIRPKKEVTK